jgi:hypothetical protein
MTSKATTSLRSLFWGTALLPLLLLSGCSEPTSPSGDPAGEPPQVQGTEGRPWFEESNPLFEGDTLPHFELELPDSLWRWLQAHATEESYVPAELRVLGNDLPQVGLRFKGNWTTLLSCFTEAGERIEGACAKLSLKLDFAEYLPQQRLFGLKRLALHSLIADDTKLHERLGYNLYRAMGVAAPRASHATLSVNGQNLGLFGLVEVIDGRFTASRWGATDLGGDGDLFKETWPSAAHSPEFQAGLRTNELLSTAAGMDTFATALPQLLAEGDVATFERFIDPQQAMAYMAVDVAIWNFDGYRTFYCWDGRRREDCASHNFYWYEAESGHRFTLIPWDLDNAFYESPLFAALPDWNDLGVSCDAPVSDQEGLVLWHPGCDPYFRMLALHYRPEYLDALRKLQSGPFRLAALQDSVSRWQRQIDPAVRGDTTLNHELWQEEIDHLLQVVLPQQIEQLEQLVQRGGAPLAN